MKKHAETRKVKTMAMAHGPGQFRVMSRPISELTLDPKNPRVHSKNQIHQLARSIGAFGFCVPVLIDRQGRVIAGHGRLLACQELGWHEVPAICLDHLTEAQTRAFQIADNRLTEIADWEPRLLGEQLKYLAEVDLPFSLEATGFAMAEIDLLIEGIAPATERTDDPVDAVPEPFSGPPVSQVEDLWLLGLHRIYCGSALEDAAYAALMGDTEATMIFTDPPYNVPIDGHASGLGRIKHRDFPMANGELTEAEFTTFLTQAFTHLAHYTINGALIYVCMDWRHLRELLAAGQVAFTEVKHLCVWDKETGGMGTLYRSQFELVFLFKSGTASHRNNVQLGQFGRYRTNLWRYPRINSFAGSTDEGNLMTLHPTIKPVALVADAILDASARHDIVLDAFLGSGTTLLAAERTGRVCHGIELDPVYVDTAIRRWQRWTSQQARHAVSGQLFDDLAATLGGHDGY